MLEIYARARNAELISYKPSHTKTICAGVKRAKNVLPHIQDLEIKMKTEKKTEKQTR